MSALELLHDGIEITERLNLLSSISENIANKILIQCNLIYLHHAGSLSVRAYLVRGLLGSKFLLEEPSDWRDTNSDPVPLPYVARPWHS